MTGPASKRAGALLGALLLSMAAVAVRLTYVQGVHADGYAETARRQRVRHIDLPAERGSIYDRNGGELAISVPARTIYANPHQIIDADQTARALAPLLEQPEGQVAAKLREDRGFVYLARRIGVVSAGKIASSKATWAGCGSTCQPGLPGIGILDESRRLYPSGSLGANVVGFIGTDGKGLSGLEYGYEQLLGGKPGFRVLEEDPSGRRIPQGLFSQVLPIPGSDLMLTIDPDIQLSAERELDAAVQRAHAKSGMAVALDPSTGEVLAMASVPTFDPNHIEHIDVNATQNRPVTAAFEPGSVNKIITVSASLQEHIVTTSEQFWVPSQIRIGDTVFKEQQGARSLDLRGILSQSSNLGTIGIAERLGGARLNTWMTKFGYGHTTGLGFPGESAGSVPDIGRWATSLPTMAIGQGLSVTTLQLVRAYATIANDGVDIEPRLVSGWVDPKGATHTPPAPRQHRVVDPAVARTMRDLLRSVVTDGTGKLAAVPGFAVAGKTGTAQKAVPGLGYVGHMSSFVGMVPADHPQVVIGVTLEDASPPEGGTVAAPVFAQVARVAIRVRHIAPAPVAPAPQRLRPTGPVDG